MRYSLLGAIDVKSFLKFTVIWILKRGKLYCNTHKEQILERKKQHYQTNKEQILEYQQQHYQTHKIQKKEYLTNYTTKNVNF